MVKPIIASTSYQFLYAKAKSDYASGNMKKARDELVEAADLLNRLSLLAEGEEQEKLQERRDKLRFMAKLISTAPIPVFSPSPSEPAKTEPSPIASPQFQNDESQEPKTDVGDFFPAEKPTVTLEDVAGLEDVKRQIDEQIVKPRENPELYAKFKKSRGSGILLYGLPGTGKTMIAKAIANKLNGAFFSIKCSDIFSKWVGESEQNIKKLFASAHNYPVSIIFFDEFEAIGASREDTEKAEKNIVPEILAEMQGFEEHPDSTLICIAATNRPWMIDSAFLRPGRFGTHFRVDLPDVDARRQIFKMKLKDVPCSLDLDFDEMVQLTDGFNSADIADGFVEKMKQSAIDRSLKNGIETQIEEEDVQTAVNSVKSSVSQSDIDNIKRFEAGEMDKNLTGFAPEPKPNVSFNDVAGLENVKKEIENEIIKPRIHPEIYASFGKKIETGILLYGLPGTGKTMIAKAIANELDAAFFSVRCSDILSKWVGGSEQNVKNLFDSAHRYKSAIIFFDEFEAIGSKREEADSNTQKLVPEILEQIQGFSVSKNLLLVLAATNRPWMIDSAFLRPGRFGTHLRVDLPDSAARMQIVKNRLKNSPCAPDLKLDRIVELTEGFNGADVSDNFIEKMKQLAIDRSLSSGKVAYITNDDIEETAKIVKSSVDPSDVENMAKFERGEFK